MSSETKCPTCAKLEALCREAIAVLYKAHWRGCSIGFEARLDAILRPPEPCPFKVGDTVMWYPGSSTQIVGVVGRVETDTTHGLIEEHYSFSHSRDFWPKVTLIPPRPTAEQIERARAEGYELTGEVDRPTHDNGGTWFVNTNESTMIRSLARGHKPDGDFNGYRWLARRVAEPPLTDAERRWLREKMRGET